MVPGRGQSSQSEPQPRPPLQQHSDFVTVFLLVDDCWHIVCRTSVKQKPFLLSDNRNSPVRHNYSIALNVCITWLKTHVLIGHWLFQPRSDWPLALSAVFWLAAGSFSSILIDRWLFQPRSDWPLALSAAFWLAAGSFSRVLIGRWLFQPRSDWPLALTDALGARGARLETLVTFAEVAAHGVDTAAVLADPRLAAALVQICQREREMIWDDLCNSIYKSD